jgi:membrane protein YdbS with pleckstrin-like domain
MVEEIKIGRRFCSTLFIVFLILKLTKTINWTWWWITSPLWIHWGIFLLILTFIASLYIFEIIFRK